LEGTLPLSRISSRQWGPKMNKYFFTACLLATAALLLGKENKFIDGLLDGAVDLVAEEAKEKKDELIDQLGDTPASSLIKGATDFAIDAGLDKYHEKKTDAHWFRNPESKIEGSFNESIDRFFSRFNSGSPSLSSPLEIHFLGGKASPGAPFLDRDFSQTNVPAFSLNDRPIDPISGGLHAAKNMEGALISARSQKDGVYRHLVGLETTSPLMASAIKQIVTWANQLNAMSIHSYDAAAALAPGLWPKIQRGVTLACEHEKIADGYDLIEAKTLCQDKKIRERALLTLSERNDQVFAGSFNVADKVLTQMGIGKTKKILMNMTGTLVSRDSATIQHFPPKHKEVLALLREGRKIENGYLLKGDGLGIEQGIISVETSEKDRILSLFKSIQEKLKTENSDFSEEEKSLLGSTHFPVATFLALMGQYNGIGSALILERYSDLIAFERTIQFMEETAETILYKAESLRASQISGYELDAYIKQVSGVLLDLRRLKEENLQKIENEQKALDYLITIEKTLREKARDG
jgi:conjugative transfer pilus assembly protein TraH